MARFWLASETISVRSDNKRGAKSNPRQLCRALAGASVIAILPEFWRRCGPAHHELRLDGDLPDIVRALFDLIEQCTRRNLSHFLQRLSDGRERRINVGRALNIVEAHHRYVARHAQACFSKRIDGANCRNIVVGKQGGKRRAAREQFLGEGITQLRRGIFTFELNNQFRAHANPHFLGHFADGVPAVVGIGASR